MHKFLATVCFIVGATSAFATQEAVQSNNSDIEMQLLKKKYYQDIFLRGKIISSQRVCRCDNRYELIKQYCNRISEPFTVLDLGAAQGYFCFRLTSDFNAQATAVDIDPGTLDVLRKLIDYNKEMCHVTLLEQKITTSFLKKLQQKKKYDVVLATNIIHHIQGNKAIVLKDLSLLGKLVFVEIPTSLKLDTVAKQLGAKPIANLSRRTYCNLPTVLYVFEN